VRTSVARARRGRRLGRGGAWLAAALVAAGCAALPRIEVPSALPNTIQEQSLTLRWALVRSDRTVRAVGLAGASGGGQWDATVALEGVDGQGRVASRGSSIVRPGFGPGPTAFEVELVPRGGETEFRLRVLRLHQYARPGR
jgi:hypothetical protein